MKRHEEDRIIELAFGELPETDAEQVQRDLLGDPAQAQKLKGYAEMREGLASLRDVPEMQMSCDRLRDAILAGGLKEPKFSGWTWLAVPVAVASCAFLLTLTTRNPKNAVPGLASAGAVQVVQENKPVGMPFDTQLTRQPRGLELIRPEAATSPLGNVAFKMGESKENAAVVEKPKPIAKVAKRVKSETVESPIVVATSVAVSEPAKMSLTAETGSAMKDELPAGSTVIFISPEQNRETGTQRATEVESASNVVIGG